MSHFSKVCCERSHGGTDMKVTSSVLARSLEVRDLTKDWTWDLWQKPFLAPFSLLLNPVQPGTPFLPFAGQTKVLKIMNSDFVFKFSKLWTMSSDFVDTPHIGHPDLWMFPPLKVYSIPTPFLWFYYIPIISLIQQFWMIVTFCSNFG